MADRGDMATGRVTSLKIISYPENVESAFFQNVAYGGIVAGGAGKAAAASAMYLEVMSSQND